MEPFEITCPHCRQRLRVTVPGLIGRKVKCPGCGERTRVERPVDSDAHEAELAGAGSGVAKSEAAETRGGGKVGRPSSKEPAPPPDSLLRALPQKEAYHESGVWARKNESNVAPESDLSGVGSDSGSGSSVGDSGKSSPPPRKAGGARGMQLDRKTLILYTSVSVGATLFIAFIILVSKGYFFGSGDRRLKRQDASAFANLGREVEKQGLWKAEPPTAQASALRSNITKLLAASKGHPALRKQVEDVQRDFDKYSAQHSKEAISHAQFSSQIARMNAALTLVSDTLEESGVVPVKRKTPR